MVHIHPKLCARPKPRRGLARPELDHPVLGKLQYINRDGGWWQGANSVAGSAVRVDLQRGTRVSEETLGDAARTLQWLQQNETDIRLFAGRELAAGRAGSNMEEHESGTPKLEAPDQVSLLCPCAVVQWEDGADLCYGCDEMPDGNLFGAHRLEVRIDSNKSPKSVSLIQDGIADLGQRILASPVPAEAVDFENSLSDQFVSRAAEWGWFEFDAELRQLLDEAIDQTTKLMQTTSVGCRTYMKAVRRLLLTIASEADNPSQTIDDMCDDDDDDDD